MNLTRSTVWCQTEYDVNKRKKNQTSRGGGGVVGYMCRGTQLTTVKNFIL